MIRPWLMMMLCTGMFCKATAQLKIGDQPTITEKSVALDVKGSEGKQGLWLPRVSDTSNSGIDGLNPPDGLLIYYTPTKKLFIRSNNAWVEYLVTSIESITAGGPTIIGPAITFNGGTLGTDFNITSSGNIVTWNIPSASIAARGLVTTSAQTFGGAKTFANGITVNNGSVLNNGTTANGTLTVTGATGSASNLILGLNSSTVPDTTTNKYLSVNPAGVVTLNSVNVTANIPVKIKSYSLEINEAPTTLNDGSSAIYTFTIPGGNLSLNSNVLITPKKTMYMGFSINWARVVNATTIEMACRTVGDKQKLNPGLGNEATFRIQVFEF